MRTLEKFIWQVSVTVLMVVTTTLLKLTFLWAVSCVLTGFFLTNHCHTICLS